MMHLSLLGHENPKMNRSIYDPFQGTAQLQCLVVSGTIKFKFWIRSIGLEKRSDRARKMNHYDHSLKVILKNQQFLILILKLLGICGNVRKVEEMNSIEGPLRKLRFCKWVSPKMQQIIKQAGINGHFI